MLETINHRGPDDCGFTVEEVLEHTWLGLGNVRLAILDLSPRGHQPMESPDGRYVLVYNGEVYNYLEVAQELGKSEVLDISSGDTAVVLAALIKWGPAAFQRFNGMWALAFYDRTTKRLLLSRDRMGVKPLYLYLDEHKFLFASEIKAILKACNHRLYLNQEVIVRYLIQSLTDAQPETFFKGIVQFPPSSFAEVCLEKPLNRLPPFQTFWTHPYEQGSYADSKPPTMEELRETFIDAVKLRLRSDVPIGLLLSGGLDSSSILGAVRKIGLLDNLRVLSVVSEDIRSNEEPFIDLMASYAGCRVEKFRVEDNPETLLDELPEACWYNDEPIPTGLSSVAHRNLMRLAHEQGVTVLLTGQGSDEQLGGYNKFLYFYLADCFRRCRWAEVATMLLGCVMEWTIIPEFRLREAKRYLQQYGKRSWNQHLGEALRDAELLDTGLGKSYQQREWRDLRFLSIPMLLHYEDRMSMSYSREMRVPFMDYRLVELLGRMPPSSKLSRGWTKAIFRKAMEGIIHPQIQWRKDKKGFNLPVGKWMRGVFLTSFQMMFAAPMLAEEQGFIKRRAAQEMYQRFLSGDSLINYKDIFNIYSFEIWLKRFKDHISGC